VSKSGPTSTPSHWGLATSADGHLVIGGCDAVELAEVYGTPLHVVDEDLLRDAARRFRRVFAEALGRVEVFYSYKTNCVPGILQVLHEEGLGAEAISPYETWLALRLGLPGERIIYNGVNKTVEGLRLAVSRGLRSINIDSMEEVHRLREVMGSARGPVTVGVRVSTGAGWKAQFGVEIDSGEALEVFGALAEIPGVVPTGLHVHLGTAIESPSTYARAVARLMDLREEVKRRIGVELGFLDLGGGFPVPTVREFDLRDKVLHRQLRWKARPPASDGSRWEEFAGAIAEVIRRKTAPGGLEAPEIYLEPGRAVTSQAQIFLLRVGVVKTRADGSRIAICDGGRSTNAAPLGSEYHEAFVANRLHAEGMEAQTIVGGLCTPGDWTFVRKDLPPLSPGDLLAVMDAGAYFTSFANDFAFPRPGIVMARDGESRVIRRRESFEALIAMDEGLPAAARRDDPGDPGA
jgi:diaminopimelate decarboxylase